MARLGAAALLVACCAALMATQVAQAAPWIDGVASFTGKEGVKSVSGGACGYGALSDDLVPDLALAGVSLKKSVLAKLPLKGCGSCLEVKCSDKACAASAKPVTVLVHDDCEECETNQINLLVGAFARLAPKSVGRVKVQYREVPCAFSGNVVVGVDSYRATGGGWVRLTFKGVNGPALSKAEILPAGGDAAVPLENVFGAAWEASKLPELPWDIRLTNVDGKSLTLAGAVTAAKTGDVVTQKNF